MILPKKCDLCGSAIDRWMHIEIGIGAREYVNIYESLSARGECDICKACFDRILSIAKGNENNAGEKD